jgi:hypothetical protein
MDEDHPRKGEDARPGFIENLGTVPDVPAGGGTRYHRIARGKP